MGPHPKLQGRRPKAAIALAVKSRSPRYGRRTFALLEFACTDRVVGRTKVRSAVSIISPCWQVAKRGFAHPTRCSPIIRDGTVSANAQLVWYYATLYSWTLIQDAYHRNVTLTVTFSLTWPS